jgi:hypothetical protein
MLPGVLLGVGPLYESRHARVVAYWIVSEGFTMVLWYIPSTRIYAFIIRLNVLQDGSDEHVIFCDQNHTPDETLASDCLLQRCTVWSHVGWSLDPKIVYLCQ